MMKTCRKCGVEKPLLEFHKGRRSRGRVEHWSRCKPCRNEDQREWRERNRERVRELEYAWRRANPEKVALSARKASLKRAYGLTLERYNAILKAQGEGCAVCGRPPGSKRLAVDHDHETGRVRGLLCDFCNRSLGWFEKVGSERVLEYLEDPLVEETV